MFLLSFDLNASKNLVYLYWKYQVFDLDRLRNDESRIYFLFYKSEINLLIDNLQIPEEIMCLNGSVLSGLEALCVLLKRFAYP